VHGGRSRKSLILSLSETGRLLVCCHAGCQSQDLAAQIEADTGIRVANRAEGIDADLAAVAEFVPAIEFTGRTGATDKAILRALAEISQRARSIEVGASLRELAELAKIQQVGTVSKSLKRLQAAELIRRVELPSDTRAAVYRLVVKTIKSALGNAFRYNAASYCELFRRTPRRTWTGSRSRLFCNYLARAD
jgi:DNA-binding MarR family transcriptional regulator